MTFEELKQVLFGRGNFGMKLGLERMREALRLLGDPHRAVSALHVAGTNGKGSTCAFAEASLRAAGLVTGLYTSPHLVHFCERIRIAGEPISEDRAAALLEQIVGRVPWALRDDGLTYFEIATAMAFLAFAGEVDVAVIEVGLGGRLDATNVVEPLACGVASLGLEHTRWLGPTLADIAREKAGIFKPGVPAVSAGQPVEAARVLSRRAAELGVPIWRPGRDYRFESRRGEPFCYRGPTGFEVRPGRVGLTGHYQRGNAALACALLEAAAIGGVRVGAEHAARGIESARWPGRLEQVARDPEVLLDGAHNPHATRALAKALVLDVLAGRELHLVFGALDDKDHAAALAPLAALARTLHFCPVQSPRSADPAALALASRRADAQVHGSLASALHSARDSADRAGVVLCCGSLYLVGEARSLLGGAAAARMPAERL